jgi:hypothetical protein
VTVRFSIWDLDNVTAFRPNDEQQILRTIPERHGEQTGVSFFRAPVESLCQALGTHGAWLTEHLPQSPGSRGRSPSDRAMPSS